MALRALCHLQWWDCLAVPGWEVSPFLLDPPFLPCIPPGNSSRCVDCRGGDAVLEGPGGLTSGCV